MVMSFSELIMRRKNVSEFIRADSKMVTIERLGKPIRTAGGGTKPGELITLLPQQVRIVQNVRRFTAGIVNAEAGDVPNGLYVLIGRHTLDIKADDYFWVDGEKLLVLGISELRRKEYTLGTLDYYGKVNRKAPSDGN